MKKHELVRKECGWVVSREMKITFILPNVGIGGGNRVIFEYARRLQHRGHKVNVVYPIIPPFPNDLLRQFGLKGSMSKFIKSKSSQIIENWLKDLRLIAVPTLSPKLKWIFEPKIPDADVTIATEWRTAYAVAQLGEEKGENFHFIQHYECWEAWNEEKCWERMRKIEKDPNRICSAMADIDTSDMRFHNTKKLVDNSFKLPLRKITISSWLRKLIEEKFGQKVEGVIPNGANLEKFYNENKTWNKRKRILSPYRNMRWKGVEDAIKAFRIVRERAWDVEFLMYGPAKGNLPAWIEFHENISDEKLRELYCSADIFLFASWVEGFGLPPMEAMACKCAVVATDVGSIPDYTIPGKTAIVVPPRRAEELAEAIVKLLEDGRLLRDIAEAGDNYIRQFTWEKAVDEFEKILSER